MKIGYARVSTAKQGESLKTQRRALLDAGCDPDHIYADQIFGAKWSRPQLTNFVDKVWVGPETISVASRFYDSTELMTHDDFIEAKQLGEVLTLSREFNTSPWGGGGGN